MAGKADKSKGAKGTSIRERVTLEGLIAKFAEVILTNDVVVTLQRTNVADRFKGVTAYANLGFNTPENESVYVDVINGKVIIKYGTFQIAALGLPGADKAKVVYITQSQTREGLQITSVDLEKPESDAIPVRELQDHYADILFDHDLVVELKRNRDVEDFARYDGSTHLVTFPDGSPTSTHLYAKLDKGVVTVGVGGAVVHSEFIPELKDVIPAKVPKLYLLQRQARDGLSIAEVRTEPISLEVMVEEEPEPEPPAPPELPSLPPPPPKDLPTGERPARLVPDKALIDTDPVRYIAQGIEARMVNEGLYDPAARTLHLPNLKNESEFDDILTYDSVRRVLESTVTDSSFAQWQTREHPLILDREVKRGLRVEDVLAVHLADVSNQKQYSAADIAAWTGVDKKDIAAIDKKRNPNVYFKTDTGENGKNQRNDKHARTVFGGLYALVVGILKDGRSLFDIVEDDGPTLSMPPAQPAPLPSPLNDQPIGAKPSEAITVAVPSEPFTNESALEYLANTVQARLQNERYWVRRKGADRKIDFGNDILYSASDKLAYKDAAPLTGKTHRGLKEYAYAYSLGEKGKIIARNTLKVKLLHEQEQVDKNLRENGTLAALLGTTSAVVDRIYAETKVFEPTEKAKRGSTSCLKNRKRDVYFHVFDAALGGLTNRRKTIADLLAENPLEYAGNAPALLSSTLPPVDPLSPSPTLPVSSVPAPELGDLKDRLAYTVFKHLVVEGQYTDEGVMLGHIAGTPGIVAHDRGLVASNPDDRDYMLLSEKQVIQSDNREERERAVSTFRESYKRLVTKKYKDVVEQKQGINVPFKPLTVKFFGLSTGAGQDRIQTYSGLESRLGIDQTLADEAIAKGLLKAPVRSSRNFNEVLYTSVNTLLPQLYGLVQANEDEWYAHIKAELAGEASQLAEGGTPPPPPADPVPLTQSAPVDTDALHVTTPELYLAQCLYDYLEGDVWRQNDTILINNGQQYVYDEDHELTLRGVGTVTKLKPRKLGELVEKYELNQGDKVLFRDVLRLRLWSDYKNTNTGEGSVAEIVARLYRAETAQVSEIINSGFMAPENEEELFFGISEMVVESFRSGRPLEELYEEREAKAAGNGGDGDNDGDKGQGPAHPAPLTQPAPADDKKSSVTLNVRRDTPEFVDGTTRYDYSLHHINEKSTAAIQALTEAYQDEFSRRMTEAMADTYLAKSVKLNGEERLGEYDLGYTVSIGHIAQLTGHRVNTIRKKVGKNVPESLKQKQSAHNYDLSPFAVLAFFINVPENSVYTTKEEVLKKLYIADEEQDSQLVQFMHDSGIIAEHQGSDQVEQIHLNTLYRALAGAWAESMHNESTRKELMASVGYLDAREIGTVLTPTVGARKAAAALDQFRQSNKIAFGMVYGSAVESYMVQQVTP